MTVSALPERPEPPIYLIEDEATLWREVVSTKPADWFMRDTHPVLAAYCQSVVMHRELMRDWHNRDTGLEPKDTKLLIELIDKQARLMAGLATKLRLTQQSRYTPDKAATVNKGGRVKPLWERGDKG